jgi:endo-1,4-beta-xylanase
MKRRLQKASLALLLAMAATACKKNADNSAVLSPGLTVLTDTAGSLKTTASAMFPNMGMAVTYGPMSTIPAFLATVKREANIITFGNELKEESVVRTNGTYDYTTADNFLNLATTNGLGVYGHVLVWHSQQNATYLNGLLAPVISAPVTTNLLANGGFESGLSNWSGYNGASSFSVTTAASEIHGGSQGLKVIVAASGAAYTVQLASDLFNTTVGTAYTLTFYIKAAGAGGKMRISTGPTAQYSADYNTTTSWAPYTFTFTAKEAQSRILFDIGYAANTYFIDDATVTGPATGVSTPLTDAQKATIIDNEMKRYITTTLTHYSGKIKAWDVVNEPFLDNGALRTNSNYTIPTLNSAHEFLYGQYIGTKYDANNYILKAFQYAKAADPVPLRFINDYNLESSKAKVDSMKALVAFVNKNGALIDGVGTQMHISMNTSLNSIDYAFKTLASTGLQVRISELDIILNNDKTAPFVANADQLNYQAALYKYVVSSYLKNVPAAQRYGITVWGVSDTDSWLNTPTTPDYPLLFDAKYQKKPAYAGFKAGLTQPYTGNLLP